MNQCHRGRVLFAPVLAAFALTTVCSSSRASNAFNESDLQSDIPGQAANLDSDLVNPWGIASSPTSPMWASDNGSGKSTLYNTAGSKLGLVVSLPSPAGGSLAPTGVVFNGDATSYSGSHFIFASEDGVVQGWNGGTSASVVVADNSASDAVYKGLAIGSVSGSTYLYATDFHNDRIDVLPGNGAPSLSGTFTDPTIPTGFAPFNITNIGGKLFVTYAMQDAARHDDVAGAGNGFVDVFNLNGDFQQRLISQGALNSPWGIVNVPGSFGSFAGDLLVGNFGDGTIDVYGQSGNFIDTLRRKGGDPIVVQGLWGLIFGNGAAGGNKNSLYFTAGIPGDGQVEDHGLFGAFTSAVPESSTTIAGAGLLALCIAAFARRRARAGRAMPA